MITNRFRPEIITRRNCHFSVSSNLPGHRRSLQLRFSIALPSLTENFAKTAEKTKWEA